MSENNTFSKITTEIGFALQPLGRALSSVDLFTSFLRQLGWSVDQIPQPIQDLGNAVSSLISNLELVIEENADEQVIEQLIQNIKEIINGISAIKNKPDAAFPANLIADNFKTEFPKQLVEFLVIDYLCRKHPKIAYVLRSLGVARLQLISASGNRPAYMANRLDLSALSSLLDSPDALLAAAFNWGTDLFDPADLIDHLDDWLCVLGLYVTLGMETEMVAFLEDELGQPIEHPVHGMKAILFARYDNSVIAEGGIKFIPLPKTGLKKPGLAIVPYSNADLSQQFQLTPNLKLSIKGDLDLSDGFGIKIRPFEPIEMVKGFSNGGSIAPVSGSLTIRMDYEGEFEEPLVLIGASGGSRFELMRLSGQGGVAFNNEAELFVELEIIGGRIVIKPGEDGFLSKVLPADGLTSEFDVTSGISNTRGFYFRGGAGLEINLPALKQIGPIEIKSFTISLRPVDGKIPINIGATVNVKLGPFNAAVENMGLKAIFDFPPDYNGNLGFLDLDIGFKPPTAIALSINAQKFSGGGYLYIGENRYAGVINLNFHGVINFTAIAIINTKLPGGREGYALLLVITAAGFKPIQLGLGFTLNGIGGLLALHRTMDLEVLRAGIRDGISDRLLFPEKPLENIDLILSDLESVFPISENRFVFGPMFIIGWGGVKTLLEIKIGLLIEVPNPVKVAITGVLRTILPTEGDGAEVVIINVSFLGTFEPEKKMIAFDASLFNSRILNFTLEGDMAFRLLYGDKPNFLLSVGGFHPAFQPPPMALGSLQRLTLSLLDEEKAKVQLEMYFAVTSNTVQVGAHMAAVFQAMGYEVVGHLGFDALFQFNPFYFKVDIQIGFALMKNGKEKAAINVALHVEGPTPWNVSGYAEMKILGIEFHLNFDKTFGEERHTILPNVDLWPLLREELTNDANWTVLLPVGGQELVQIRVPEPPPNAAPGSLVISPAGSIQVSQRLIPLKTVLQQYGNQGIDGSNRFEITRFTINGVDIGTLADSYETFAPAQYQRLSDAEKLSGSSFISAISGVKTAESYASKNGPAVMRDISYDVILIDGPDRYYLLNSYLANANKQQADFNTGDDVGLKTVKNGQAESLNTGVKTNLPNDRYRYVIGADRLETHRKNGATGQSQWAKVNQAKQLVTDRKIPLLEERYRIVHIDTLDPYIDTGIYLESDARNVLAGILAAHPAMQDDLRIVPEYAVSEVAYIDESLNLANA